MKKLSLAVLMSMVLAACTAHQYAKQGNATVLMSKNLPDNQIELVVKKDSGETVTLTQTYDSYITVGSRVDLAGDKEGQLKIVHRYEFK